MIPPPCAGCCRPIWPPSTGRSWREEISPGFGFDGEMQRKSLRWLREMAEDPACAGVLCSHAPDLSPGTLEF